MNAYAAVRKALKTGELLRPSAYPCHVCHQPACDYHHASYRADDVLCVVPLCRKCHRHLRPFSVSGTQITPDFGVVPTSVGLVRIAIAGLDEYAAVGGPRQ